MVPDWPLRLVISPLSNITLSIEQRDVLHIPASAISYTWVYPASLDWRDVPQDILQNGDSDLKLLSRGGFAYIDAHFRIVKVTSIGESSNGGLCFDKPIDIQGESMTASLWQQQRFHRVTIQRLVEMGMTHFAWVNGGELFHGVELRGNFHGGFVYTRKLEEEEDPTNLPTTPDYFFPVLAAETMDAGFASCKVDAKSSSRTALMYMAERGSETAVRDLVAAKADVNLWIMRIARL